jgi:Fe-S oxidoreductase
MLRAKAIKFRKGDTKFRDSIITSTDMVGKLASKPLINSLVNGGNNNAAIRGMLDSTLGIHKDAKLPPYAAKTARRQNAVKVFDPGSKAEPRESVGRVALFTTCYCNYNEPHIADSVIKVLEHNNVEVVLPEREHCCGMPKLELGDLATVNKLKEQNIPVLQKLAREGYAIIAAVPSCVLMFKQELPLMYPGDEAVQEVAAAFHDPFEYLHKLHKDGKLRTDFKTRLGNISYHVACHQRVQNIGPKTRQILELIEDTTVNSIERCSGHDGTYGVKKETLQFANKIAKPIIRQIEQQEADHYGSDCPVAGRHLENNLNSGKETSHPIDLLRLAYGI